MPTLEAVSADITTLDVDVVVNAAKPSLLGGGGVDGAIHRAAGPELLDFCRTLGGCETGDAKISPGFGLLAPWIVHTVGPIYQGGGRGEAGILAAAYRNSLREAERIQAKSVAFPSISTGAYPFPLDRAAGIALATIVEFLKT